jgi:hypothetical protein
VAWLLTLPQRPAAWLVFASGLPVLLLGSWRAHLGRPGGWPANVRQSADVHALALVLLLALGVQFADTHGVTTDGVIYFSQLRSVIYDGDLDVAAEFAALGQPSRPSHVVPIGPTLVWALPYLAVAAIDAVARWSGLWTMPPAPALVGLTAPFIRSVLLTSFAVGAAGLLVIHLRLRREFGGAVALFSSLLLFGATPLVWYMVYEPSMTHAASFGFVAFFIVAAERWTTLSIQRGRSMALGALLGLAFVTRPQEALFAIFPAMILALATAPWSVRLRGAMRMAGWALVGALPFVLLQAVHSSVLLSREAFRLTGDAGGYLDVWNSRWADTLWSSWHGFFSWTPVAYLAALGSVAYIRRHPAWAVSALVLVFAMAWVNGATTDWAAGWSFGGRRFTSVLVMLAPGVALLVRGLIRTPVVAIAIAAMAAIAWNALLVTQYARGMLRADDPVSFAEIVRQQASLATAPPFVYPFAFPANVLFAWRTGLPVGHYDLLGSESLRQEISLEMTPDADRYLTSGWGAHVEDSFGALRWIDGEQAALLLPLEIAPTESVVVSWSARTRRLDPPVFATFALVLNGRETFRFTPDTDQSSHYSFTVPPGEGWWVRGFNRVVFERRSGGAPVGVYRLRVQAESAGKGS